SRLAVAGHTVVGHDLAPERMTALTARGGEAADSARAVAERADLVGLALPSLAAVEDVILGPDGIGAGRPGRTVVIHMSTLSPALTERLAREMAAGGVDFLDCPVSGTSAMVSRGQGIFICGGRAEVFARCRPVLEAALPHVVHVGPAGHAMMLKLVANL